MGYAEEDGSKWIYSEYTKEFVQWTRISSQSRARAEWFTIEKGVWQGCVSPMLFSFYSEEVMQQSMEDLSWIGVNVSGKKLNNLCFADDIVLITTSPERLQSLLDEVDQVSSEYQLEISTKKTKTMVATRVPEQISIQCRGVKLDQVEWFKYLGSIIEQKADGSHEIKAQLGAAQVTLRSLNALWKDCSLHKSIKLKLLKTLVWPIALYRCETWTLRVAETKKLRTFEMLCYRYALRISWTAHHTIELVLEEMATEQQLVVIVRKWKL